MGGGGALPACPESFRIGVADVRQLIGGRCRRGGGVLVDGDREAGGLADLLRRDSGMEAGGPNAAGREVEDAQGRDQRGGTAAAPTGEVARGGDVVDPPAKPAPLLLHDQPPPARP